MSWPYAGPARGISQNPYGARMQEACTSPHQRCFQGGELPTIGRGGLEGDVIKPWASHGSVQREQSTGRAMTAMPSSTTGAEITTSVRKTVLKVPFARLDSILCLGANQRISCRTTLDHVLCLHAIGCCGGAHSLPSWLHVAVMIGA